MIDTGLVLFGNNNIFTVSTDRGTIECRIKGKILRGTEREYAPLAPGDIVRIEIDLDNRKGLIVKREERTNRLVRWNKKRRCPQTIGVNIDTAFVVSSPVSPPFRPRFIDRVILAAELGKVPINIILNKVDQGISTEVEERLALFQKLGYSVFYSDALKGEGLEPLKTKMQGRRVILIGQSGVGKTTLLNGLFPSQEKQKTEEISTKWNRGKHTTNVARLFIQDGLEVIDTPGIREIEIAGVEPEELKNYFPELERFDGTCEFPNCLHVNEPGCSVLNTLDSNTTLPHREDNVINRDRYISYTTILKELRERSVCYG